MFLDELTGYFARLEKSRSRLWMYAVLGELFDRATAPEIAEIASLCEGRVLPAFTGVQIGMGDQLLIESIALAAGSQSAGEVRGMYKSIGDLGSVAEKLVPSSQSKEITVADAYRQLLRIARTAGAGSIDRKIQLLAALLRQCSAGDARWVVRFVSGRIRLGVGPITMLEAVARRFSEPKRARAALERAWNLCSDLGLVLKTVRRGGLEAIARCRVRPGNPVRSMMAERLSSAEEIVQRLGVCAVESKLDGFRCELHLRRGKVEIFSRNQERTTEMFPDLVASARRQLPVSTAILDGEAVAVNDQTRYRSLGREPAANADRRCASPGRRPSGGDSQKQAGGARGRGWFAAPPERDDRRHRRPDRVEAQHAGFERPDAAAGREAGS